MRVGILILDAFDISVASLTRPLAERGYETAAALYAGDDFVGAAHCLTEMSDALLVCGNTARFVEWLGESYDIGEKPDVFSVGDKSYALCEKPDAAFIENTVVPMLNAGCRTFYTTARFRTFGRTEAELRDWLKDLIKNRNRIVFDFYPSLCECEVTMRYSSKTAKASVDDMIAEVATRLKDCTYAFDDKSLAETVSDLLKVRGRRLCLAESFTGGAIAAALTAVPGASSYLYEGIVCYAPEAKTDRLGVDKNIIDTYGAVSIETVYEMAAGLLMRGKGDIVVATTGNAGPTAEKEGDVGHCFLAVGDAAGIHIYEYRFSGSRAEVIESGVKHALFRLYKKLRQNEFEELLKAQEAKEREKA